MTEELKYKVGDKVLIEAEVDVVGSTSEYQYGLTYSKTGDFLKWVTADELDRVSVTNPPKPKVTQAVMDWYNSKDTYTYIADYFEYASPNVRRWLSEDVKNEHALATLIAYGLEAVEVDKDKRYRVKIKGVDQYLRRVAFSNKFEFHEAFPDDLTKQEIIKAGFGGVFDNPMFEVEEVE